jgi:hypothetical protein
MPQKTTKKPAARATTRRTTKKPVKRSIFAKLFLRKNGKPNFVAALVVVLAVSGLGYFGYVQSSANTTPYEVAVSSEEGCKLAGRKWEGGDCKKECRHTGVAGNTYKQTNGKPVRGYCSAAVNTNIDISRCNNDLHRKYVKEIGCSRRPAQLNTNDANQCIPPFDNYVAENNTDKCIQLTIVNTGQDTPGAGGGSGGGNGGNGGNGNNNNNGGNKNNGGGNGGNNGGAKNNGGNTGNNNGGNSGASIAGNNAGIQTQTPTAPTSPQAKALTEDQCKLLGREWKNKKCADSCPQDRGPLVVGERSGNNFCRPFVAVGIDEENCVNKYHRVWALEGCAKRPNDKDGIDKLRCQKDYPYFNANFTSPAGATNTDVCEADQATATENETNGILGGAVVPNMPDEDTTTDTSGQPTTPESRDTVIKGNFKITVYADVNFKGKSKTFTTDTPEMPKNWNDQVSSFKIHKGQWEFCADTNFGGVCTKRWAGDADLTKGNKDLKNDSLSSLRPYLRTEFEPVVAKCLDADGNEVEKTAEGCPEDSEMSCGEGVQLVNGTCQQQVYSTAAFAPVDKSFKGDAGKEKCKLLGREWIAKGNGGNYGCSMVSCAIAADGAPRDNDGKPFCVSNKFGAAYAVKSTKEECSKLHRVWVAQVELCAQVPNRKDKDQTVVNAQQCEKGYDTYYIYKAKDKEDECFKPKFVQNVQAVVSTTGGALGSALQVGPKGFCALKKGFHWADGKCVKNRPAPKPSNGGGQTTGAADNPGGGIPAGDGKINCGPMGTVTGSTCPYANESVCNQLHREWSGGVCQPKCDAGWTGYTVASPYNKCVSAGVSDTGNSTSTDGSYAPAVVSCTQFAEGYNNSYGSKYKCYQDYTCKGVSWPSYTSTTGGKRYKTEWACDTSYKLTPPPTKRLVTETGSFSTFIGSTRRGEIEDKRNWCSSTKAGTFTYTTSGFNNKDVSWKCEYWV